MTTRMLMFQEYRVAPDHNSETNDQFFGNVAKSKISGERHHTNADCVQGHTKNKFCFQGHKEKLNSVFKDTNKNEILCSRTQTEIKFCVQGHKQN